MPAATGNQYWKLRKRHGRNTLFPTPDKLLEAAYQYFDWATATPLYRHQLIKTGPRAGQIMKVPRPQPFTVMGLCLYIGCNTAYFRHLKSNTHFAYVVERIESIIYVQQFEGACIGIFNPKIIARSLSMRAEHRWADEQPTSFVIGPMPELAKVISLPVYPGKAAAQSEESKEAIRV